jgi:hypothetical protein
VFGRLWHGYDIPRHLYHFTPATLGRYLSNAGFGAIACRQSIVPTSWIWSLNYVLGGKATGTGRYLTPDSPLLLAAFLPVGILGALAGRSGRMMITARNTAATGDSRRQYD